jgi:two-component system response regulator DegU
MESFIDEIMEAQDGREALMKVEQSNPDVVLMDLNMPHLNGLEATRILHQSNPGLRIIGLSVQSEEETAQAMIRAGAIAYLNKNTDTDILIEKLKTLAQECLAERS